MIVKIHFLQLDKTFSQFICFIIMKVVTSDGAVFEIDSKITKLSGFLTENVSKDKSSDNPIPLPKISSPVMKKVIEWAEHHKEDPLTNNAGVGGKKNDGISAWDSQFLRVDQKMLCQLILAATHLKMDGLMDLLCKSA